MSEIVVISAKDRDSLDALKSRVATRVYSLAMIKAIMAGDMPPPGDYKEFYEKLECGIRIVFSYEIQKDGFLYRHASISIYDESKYRDTFKESPAFNHLRENVLNQTVYALGINPKGIFPMICWGEKTDTPAVNFLQRVSDLDAADSKEVGYFS
jgi:hypothetical protein